MTIANIFLGLVIASIFGCGFHFWRGGEFKWLILFNVFAWIGFWLGHFVGAWTGIRFLPLGPINLGPAILGTLVVLFLGYWLSMASQEDAKKKNE